MLRFLTYWALGLLLLTACSRDPLSVERVALGNEPVEMGYTDLDAGQSPLLPGHETLTLRCSFLASDSGSATLLLDGRYPLTLPDLRLNGELPEQPVSPSSGVWHDLELQYQPADAGSPAIVPALYLDGNPVYYSQVLADSDTPAGPLSWTVESGEVTLADLRYAPVAGRSSRVDEDGVVQLNVPLLRYDYYHLPEGSKTFTGWEEQQPEKTGYISRVDLNGIRERGRDYAVRFTGIVNVPKADEYYFKTWGTGKTELYLDGELVSAHRGAPEQWSSTDSLRLTEGNHEVDLRIVQHHNWNVNRVTYRRAGSDEEERFLNAMEPRVAIATPAAKDPLAITDTERPYLLRSFLYYPAPKLYESAEKRTHVVSVGEGQGPHYSVDLQTGALLQVWRGGFADVYDMWVGRGEPQVMRPLGPAVQLDGSPLFAASDGEVWPTAPENPDQDDFVHEAYELDAAGRPTFYYYDDAGSYSDRLTPQEGGLLREITRSAAGPDNYVQLSAAASIEEVAPGEFQLRNPGLRLRIESYDGGGLTIQRSGGRDRLLARMNDVGHVRYRIDW